MFFEKPDSIIDEPDEELRRIVFLRNMKTWALKIVFIILAIVGFMCYEMHIKTTERSRVDMIDRRAAAKEAVTLYSEAHPELSQEEINEIFRNFAP